MSGQRDRPVLTRKLELAIAPRRRRVCVQRAAAAAGCPDTTCRRRRIIVLTSAGGECTHTGAGVVGVRTPPRGRPVMTGSGSRGCLDTQIQM
jgi:hypothetical protein